MTFYYFDIRLSSVILSFEVPRLKEVKNKLKYFPVFPPHGDIFHCKAISKLICAICGWTAYFWGEGACCVANDPIEVQIGEVGLRGSSAMCI